MDVRSEGEGRGSDSDGENTDACLKLPTGGGEGFKIWYLSCLVTGVARFESCLHRTLIFSEIYSPLAHYIILSNMNLINIIELNNNISCWFIKDNYLLSPGFIIKEITNEGFSVYNIGLVLGIHISRYRYFSIPSFNTSFRYQYFSIPDHYTHVKESMLFDT